MTDYCKHCQKEVGRCWQADGMCGGGGHCDDCGGYDFETEEEQEEREANAAMNKVLENE